MKVLLFVLSILSLSIFFSCATTTSSSVVKLEYDDSIQKMVIMTLVNLWETGIYTKEQLGLVADIVYCPIYIESGKNIICEQKEENNTKSIIRCPGFMSFDKYNKPFIKIAGDNPNKNKVLVHEFLHYSQWRIENKLDESHQDTRIFNHNCSTMACRIESIETIVDDQL